MQHHQHHGNCCGKQMGQMQPIVCPTQYRFRDQFIPQVVPVIHPIVNVNREHIVPVPRHFYTETTENVMGAPVMPGFGPGAGGFGPGIGGFGPGFRGPGRRPRF